MNEATHSIDQLIEGLEDWRGPRLAELRGAIRSSDPSIFET